MEILGVTSIPMGLRTMKALAMVGWLFLVAACQEGPDPDVSAVKKRASFEIDCPKSEVKAFWIDDKTIGVKGCGQKLVYVQACRGQGITEECQWILNSDSRRRRED
jgi:hypothetical protein